MRLLMEVECWCSIGCATAGCWTEPLVAASYWYARWTSSRFVAAEGTLLLFYGRIILMSTKCPRRSKGSRKTVPAGADPDGEPHPPATTRTLALAGAFERGAGHKRSCATAVAAPSPRDAPLDKWKRCGTQVGRGMRLEPRRTEAGTQTGLQGLRQESLGPGSAIR